MASSPAPAPDASNTAAPGAQLAAAQVAAPAPLPAPAPAVAPQPLPQPHLAAQLADLPQAVDAVVRVAVDGSATSAHIVLSPPELGQVHVELHYGADGVSATLTADHPEAAQALGQSAGELRRSLEAQGVAVQTINVGHAGTEADRGARRDPNPTPSGGATARLDDVEPEEISIPTSRLRLGRSAVDILA